MHDGSKFDTNEYPLLAQRYPNGIITDLRGYFIRGLDTTGNVDNFKNGPRPILSFEEGSHLYRDFNTSVGSFVNNGGFNTATFTNLQWDSITDPNTVGSQVNVVAPQTSFSPGGVVNDNTVGVARPKNIAYNYISFTGKSLPNTSLSLYENNAIDFKNILTLESTDTSPISSNNSTQIPNKNWVNSNYLPLTGGILQGDVYHNNPNATYGSFATSTQTRYTIGNSYTSLWSQVDGNRNNSIQQVVGGLDNNGNYQSWIFNPTCKNILSPNLNPYSEIIGFNNSSRVVTQRFTANLNNGSWQTFPIAFANDDVTIIFTNSTKGGWINVVGLIQDSSIAPPSNRYGFLPSISAQQPGGSFWNLGNTVTFEIVAIGMM